MYKWQLLGYLEAPLMASHFKFSDLVKLLNETVLNQGVKFLASVWGVGRRDCCLIVLQIAQAFKYLSISASSFVITVILRYGICFMTFIG